MKKELKAKTTEHSRSGLKFNLWRRRKKGRRQSRVTRVCETSEFSASSKNSDGHDRRWEWLV